MERAEIPKVHHKHWYRLRLVAWREQKSLRCIINTGTG